MAIYQNDGVISVGLWVDQARFGGWSRDESITYAPDGSLTRKRYQELAIPSLDGLEKQGKASLVG